MDTAAYLLLKTSLSDRDLWFDGVSAYKASNIDALLQKYNVCVVDEITPEIQEYNKHVRKIDEIVTKHNCELPIPEWVIPKLYSDIDLERYIFDKHTQVLADNMCSAPEQELRTIRLCEEFVEFEDRNFLDLLRTMIYMVDQLTLHQIIWGVGRGSSVSSYLLYVIGVHDVDSFEFDLDIQDFMHE